MYAKNYEHCDGAKELSSSEDLQRMVINICGKLNELFETALLLLTLLIIYISR
jgi:hypothetical protein